MGVHIDVCSCLNKKGDFKNTNIEVEKMKDVVNNQIGNNNDDKKFNNFKDIQIKKEVIEDNNQPRFINININNISNYNSKSELNKPKKDFRSKSIRSSKEISPKNLNSNHSSKKDIEQKENKKELKRLNLGKDLKDKGNESNRPKSKRSNRSKSKQNNQENNQNSQKHKNKKEKKNEIVIKQPLNKTNVNSCIPKKIDLAKYKNRSYINIVILGGPYVGKSAFIIKFAENKYENFYVPAIGKEFKSKTVCFNKRNYKINLWAMSGNEYKNDEKRYYSTADFFFVFYDVTNEKSLQDAQECLKVLDNYLMFFEKDISNIALIGNKIDLLKGEQNNENELKNIKNFSNYQHYEISVLTYKNINNLMNTVISIFDKIAFS